jgi:hypothetical protein
MDLAVWNLEECTIWRDKVFEFVAIALGTLNITCARFQNAKNFINVSLPLFLLNPQKNESKCDLKKIRN